MHTFKDNAGREWAVEVNTHVVKRVRELTKVDLGQAGGEVPYFKVLCDPVTLCDVLFAVIKPEADGLGVTDEDFGKAMAGDAIDHATKALIQAVVDFQPDRKERENLRTIFDASWKAQEAEWDVLAADLRGGKFEQDIAAKLKKETEKAFKDALEDAHTPETTVN